jgi:GntR family transcriptional repressor for pyruvate dehydrogenase complex
VVADIEKRVLNGRLTIGTRLPPEREMAEQMGVSRTVVRESVRILVARGLLETRHGIGTTVRIPTRHEVVKPLSLLLQTGAERVTTEHLHAVRSMLEVENAALAAANSSAEEVEDLRRLCREMKEAAHDPELFAAKDSEFHRRIAAATHNPLLSVLLDSLQDLMAEVRKFVSTTPGLASRVMPTHSRIVDSIAAQDAEAARQSMREHLEIAIAVQQATLAARS